MQISYKYLMNYFKLSIAVLLLTGFGSCFSQEGEAHFDSLALTSTKFTIEHKYAEAESCAVKIIDDYPDSPAGYLYRVGVLSSMMIDYEELIRVEDFDKYLDKCIEISEKRIKSEPENPWNYYYLGGAYLNFGLHNLRQENFFQALIQGLRAIKYLRKTVELDSGFYDAYLGIGNYSYWLSRKTEFLKWMPFITDNREEGIKMMFTSVEKGKYSGDTGASSLAWILIDAGRYQEAVDIAEKLLLKYPDSRFFLYAKGRALYEMEQYQESLDIYLKLMMSVRNAPVNNHFNELGILVKLTENSIGIGNYKDALKYCREGLSIELTYEMKKRKQKTLDILRSLAEKCEKQLDNR